MSFDENDDRETEDPILQIFEQVTLKKNAVKKE